MAQSQVTSTVTQPKTTAAQRFAEGMHQEIKDVQDKAAKGDLLGAALELSDVLSVGGVLSEALSAIGSPNDPVTQNLVSAAINFSTSAVNPLGLVAGLKDLADAGVAHRARCGNPEGAIAKPHLPPAPARLLQQIEKKRASLPKGFPRVPRRVTNFPMPLRPGATFIDWQRWLGTKPAIMRPVRIELLPVITSRLERTLRENGVERNGPSCREKPLAERSISDILNDKSLCFEDMVAMVMAKVCQDMQGQVEEQIRKLEGMTSKGGASGGGGAAGDGRSSAGAAQASTRPRPRASEGKRDAKNERASQTKETDKAKETKKSGKKDDAFADMLWRGLDFLLAGPIVGAIGQGLTGDSLSKQICKEMTKFFGDNPELLAVAVDGAKALAPVLAPMVAAAVAAIPGVGPFLAPLVPVLLPMIVDGLGDAIKAGAQAAAQEKAAKGASAGGSNAPSTGSARTSTSTRGNDSTKRRASSNLRHATPREARQLFGPPAAKAGGAEPKKDQDSINLEMEKLKLLMQRMQEMQQAMSNVLNSMHQGAMNSVRNIK